MHKKCKKFTGKAKNCVFRTVLEVSAGTCQTGEVGEENVSVILVAHVSTQHAGLLHCSGFVIPTRSMNRQFVASAKIFPHTIVKPLAIFCFYIRYKYSCSMLERVKERCVPYSRELEILLHVLYSSMKLMLCVQSGQVMKFVFIFFLLVECTMKISFL